jgi:hypothetical protein
MRARVSKSKRRTRKSPELSPCHFDPDGGPRSLKYWYSNTGTASGQYHDKVMLSQAVAVPYSHIIPNDQTVTASFQIVSATSTYITQVLLRKPLLRTRASHTDRLFPLPCSRSVSRQQYQKHLGARLAYREGED